MIALAILAIALTAIGGLRNRDILQHALARDMTVATMLAQQRLGELEVAGFPALGETTGKFDAPYDGFEWAQSISITPFEFAREIRVRVAWKTLLAEESVELVAYVIKQQ
jgi:general secretion pathway protein I